MPEQFVRPSFNRVLVNGQWVDIPEELMPAPSVNPNVDQLFAGAMPWAQPATSPTLLDMIARAPHATPEPSMLDRIQGAVPWLTEAAQRVYQGGMSTGAPTEPTVAPFDPPVQYDLQGQPITPPQGPPQLSLLSTVQAPMTGIVAGLDQLNDTPGDVGAAARAAGQALWDAPITPPEQLPTLASKARERGVPVDTVPGLALDLMSGLADPTNLLAPEKLLGAGTTLAAAAPLASHGSLLNMLKGSKLSKTLKALETTMRPGDYQAVLDAVQARPRMADMLQWLEPAEIGGLVRAKPETLRQNLDEALELYDYFDDPAYFRAAMLGGQDKRGWYLNSTRALKLLTGNPEDADLMAGIMAATSPQNGVDQNLENTLNFFVNWKAAGRPTDDASIKRILGASVQGNKGEQSALPAWVNNLGRVLRREPGAISGQKVDSFYLALRERLRETQYGTMTPEQANVLDTWMANYFGITQPVWARKSGNKSAAMLASGNPGLTPGYAAGTAKLRAGADSIGFNTREAQETVWSFAYALYNKAEQLKISAREVIQRGLLTKADIVGVPDFALLLQDPRYANIIKRDPELAARLPELQAMAHEAYQPVQMTQQDRDWLLKGADTLDALRSQREVDTRITTGRNNPRGVDAVFVQEAVPDKASRLAPTSMTAKERKAFSEGVFEALEDLKSRNRLLEAAAPGRTGSRIKATGAWMENGQFVNNPAAAQGMSMSIDPATGQIVPQEFADAQAAQAVQMYTTGQTAGAFNAAQFPVGKPQASGNMVRVETPQAMTETQVRQLQRARPNDAIVNTGRGVSVLGLNGPMTTTDAETIGDLVRKGTGTSKKNAKRTLKPRVATNLAANSYQEAPSLAKVNSRERTEWVLSMVDQATPETRGRLDVEVQKVAQKLLAGPYADAATRADKGRTRKDEINALRILARGGLTALRAAFQDPQELLPVLAGLGILPAAYAATQGAEVEN